MALDMVYSLLFFFFVNECVKKVHLSAADEAPLSGAPALLAYLKFGHKDPSEGSSNPHPRRNLCTNSQQATPIPALTNKNVRLGLIHSSATLFRPPWPVIQTILSIDVMAPTVTGAEEILAATPSQTCRHGRRDKSLWFG